MSTADEIVEVIHEAKTIFTVLTFTPLLVNDQGFGEWLLSRGFDPGSTTNLRRKEGSQYAGIDLYRAFEEMVAAPQRNLAVLRATLLVGLVTVGDAMKTASMYDGSPGLEFLRHVRNAAAHGNRFNLMRGEPKRPAHFRDFEITGEDLNGKTLLFDFMLPGDVFDLFDYLMDHVGRDASG